MGIISFTVPGKPYAKKRPRFSRRSGRAYDPEENAVAEASIGHIAAQYFDKPISGPIGLEVLCIFAMPESWSKAKKEANALNWHTQKPDCDNVVKAVKDALTRIAWADDAQVCREIVKKSWGDHSYTSISVIWGDDLR